MHESRQDFSRDRPTDGQRSAEGAEGKSLHGSMTDRTSLATHVRNLAVLAFVVVVLFHRLLLGERLCAGANIYETIPFASIAPDDFESYGNSIQGDAWRQHGVWQQKQYDAARVGRFPLWNPYPFLGMAFHGNGQTALLHPFSWPYYFFEPNEVRGWLAMFRLWASSSAFYVLLLRWGFGAGPALIASVAWMLVPFNIRWLHWPLSHSSLWLPILLLSLDLFATRPSIRRWILASLAATVLQLAGHPETQFQAGLAAGLSILPRCGFFAGRLRWSLGVVLGLFAAMSVGSLLAAPQLLPFLVQLPESADWVHHIHGSPNGLSSSAWILFLAQDFWGRPRAGNPYEGPANYIEAGVGVGLIALVLAVVGVIAAIRSNRTQEPMFAPSARAVILCFAVFSLVFIAVLFGVPFIADLVMKLPLFDQANRLRWSLATQFWLCTMAAGGAGAIGRSRRLGRWPALILLASTIVLLVVLLLGRYPARFSKIKTAFRQPNWRTVVHHPAVRTTAALICAVGAAGWLASKLGERGRVRLTGLGLALTLEGLVHAWDFNATAPKALADPEPTPSLSAAMIIAGSGRLIGTSEVLFPNLSARYGYRDVSGYDWPLPLRLFDALRYFGWRVVEGASLPRSAFLPAPSRELAAFLSRSSVQIVYSDLRQDEVRVGGRVWKQIAVGASPDAIYRNPDALPRARFAKKPRWGSAEEAMAALRDPSLDAASIVELRENDSSPVPPLPTGDGTATFLLDGFEQVEIEADSLKGGVLVLADRMAPGWQVEIDGEPATALTIDYLFRGVVIPAGRHRVLWHYKAPGLELGCWMSACAGGLLAVLAALSFVGRTAIRPMKPG